MLKSAWAQMDAVNPPSQPMRDQIEAVLKASDVTFKYILVTGYLAKCIDPSAHARALQVGSKLQGAYDARSLCHKVVIGFEKSKGNLWGLSNEPFVNKPARHAEHDGENNQLKNKSLARSLHSALESANNGSASDRLAGLIHILRIGKQHAANEKVAAFAADVNLMSVVRFSHEIIAEADGGARLVAIWGAFQTLLNESCEVKVYSPNAADFFSKTAGDVEVYLEDKLVSASECKQRPLTLDDVQHGIGKATKNQVPEYLFVISAGLEAGQEDQIGDKLRDISTSIDTTIITLNELSVFLLAASLNPIRRARFGETTVNLLRKMRKFDSANRAAEIWNKITGSK